MPSGAEISAALSSSCARQRGTRLRRKRSFGIARLIAATIARPHLEALRDAVGETAYLVILSQGEIVQLCKADGQHVVLSLIHI